MVGHLLAKMSQNKSMSEGVAALLFLVIEDIHLHSFCDGLPGSCSYEEYQQHLLNQLASPGTALRFEVDTVFKAADVKTQALCMPTQVLSISITVHAQTS